MTTPNKTKPTPPFSETSESLTSSKAATENTSKITEQEMQEWLDKVHFGSCCSDEPDS
ncbi:hypothetical protein MHO82_24285 [Vibrio sp. Of7-15]|uniref:hypothetical protein n=1 Tax=Vibrio sp. Of7-15 TaxID=2724879 RepID=UPI001EF3415F|nr:hypothetical protein [Vibrio sp. Of7-15]MCG7499988.1 hypothetical protein [Vibrio sp. Of7-15]